MSYRTLEEKFLADYEALEKENMALQDKVQELLEKLAAQKGNRVLDAAVRSAGRAAVLEKSFIRWRTYSANDREFETWVQLMTEGNLPNGVSLNEFIEYFDEEITERYEKQYEEDEAKLRGEGEGE